uniref:Phospholipid-transporting ATPase (EC) n=1 Tax=Ganoderma boninense TaxID=34458 RepID=A0A5K1K387_9APHY|nr:Phospholipid-transporting ATPase (EC [Ganoderma boninense]
MLYSATAWSWLTRDCVARIQEIISAIDRDAAAFASSSDWLAVLVRDVFAKVQQGGPAAYQASRYLPWIESPSRTTSAYTSIRQQSDAAAHTSKTVLHLLRKWLCFPNNTSLLASYFVIHVLNAFKNADVLMLPGVWGAYRSVQASILGTNKRSSSLQLEMLDPFVRAIQQLPLSESQTEERRAMEEISAILDKCLPGLRSLVESLANPLIGSPPTQPEGNNSLSTSVSFGSTSSPRTSLINNASEDFSTSEEEWLIHELVALQPQLTCTNEPSSVGEQGIETLLSFVAELLPLINLNAIPPQLTPLQSLVNSNHDFFLPFRERAPSRLRLTSPEGPFHSHHADSPGAFPSWVISRALLFNSQVLLKCTHGYFCDLAAWNALLSTQGFDPHKNESLDQFFNIRCYGTPQPRRRSGNDFVPRYFAQEAEWRQLEEHHSPAPIPFLTCVQWFLDQPLAMVGDLTAYLLAADLTYTGKVTSPTLNEVGRAIWTMKAGSLAGLVFLGFLASEKASLQQITSAFNRLYEGLDARLTEEDKASMGWDPIMAEHLLCKITRTKRKDGQGGRPKGPKARGHRSWV